MNPTENESFMTKQIDSPANQAQISALANRIAKLEQDNKELRKRLEGYDKERN